MGEKCNGLVGIISSMVFGWYSLGGFFPWLLAGTPTEKNLLLLREQILSCKSTILGCIPSIPFQIHSVLYFRLCHSFINCISVCVLSWLIKFNLCISLFFVVKLIDEYVSDIM